MKTMKPNFIFLFADTSTPSSCSDGNEKKSKTWWIATIASVGGVLVVAIVEESKMMSSKLIQFNDTK
ncbi:hypothetical protein PPL_06297 [Heterostelium album PN500]|uniref:Uncharacterized protein n=1 Tax=Heterostelium pallidum (strain ATCC 26659 / Pp 5 / PN500) TaxID=670386 RepID=D3BCR9_HETP5|nr:hypothetical protein PPL_06297 [Heterostelium album PN500]EFA80711.1 hypothetical protein PPL_06297 [Heterostelium album PN500]|eukprot:XP_020432831.1 hypothetical protein PPL_06297 [Heterostelium album PN500]